MIKLKPLLLLTLSFLAISCNSQKRTTDENNIFNYPNVINIKNSPKEPKDLKSFCQFDLGSWLGYALPKHNTQAGTFVGPFSSIHSEWLSGSIAKLFFIDTTTGQVIKPEKYTNVSINSYPGLLSQNFEIDSCKINLNLFFVSSQTAVIKLDIQNNSKKIRSFRAGWEGNVNKDYKFMISDNTINFSFNKVKLNHNVNMSSATKGDFEINADKNQYYYHFKDEVLLDPGKDFNSCFTISITSSDKEIKTENLLIKKVYNSPNKYYNLLTSRWNGYLKNIFSKKSKWSNQPEYKTIAVKSLITLINNWKAPLGIIKHDGLFPAYSTGYFNGFWAWDSWKHSVALVHFEPELAKNQIRSMFDFQNEYGMIVDCINTDESNDYNSWNLNWLNTKPPLATWSVWKVFEETNDLNFLKEMYPKLLKYHKWWYENRDHDKNGICEYGSSLPKVYACKWESGMDDGVRFDKAEMVKNNDHANSLTQESMDLNSFLVYEKELLSKISETLKMPDESKRFQKEVIELKEKIQKLMFDLKTGYFYDITLDKKEHIVVQGSEGWIPLWTNVATKEQAKHVVQNMLDPNKFGTYIPLPTMAKDHPKFFSKGNYWRGPVWLDQVYFGIESLKNYGYNKEADIYTKQIFDRLEGLKSPGLAIRENYNPLNGEGKFGHNFSWSAAHLLLLFMEE